MPRSFTRTIRGRQRQVRETSWLFLPTVEATLGGAPTAALITTFNAAALAIRPFTIIRTRGIIGVRSDQSGATESFIGDLAMSVVTNQATLVGVTAVPTPLTDKGSDMFFVYEQVISRFQQGDATGQMLNMTSIQYDSKAMRRVNDDQDLAVVVENELNGCVIVHSGRMLIKLH